VPQTDTVKIGRFRFSRARFWKWVYRLMALGIAFMFVSALIYMILFGTSPQ
jgi:hypothetical protein